MYQQVKCFGASLQRSDVTQIKKMVEQNVPEGVNSAGLTFRGFVEIHNMFLKKGRTETFWEVLRKFGYGNDLKLRDDILKVPSKQASDQVILTFCFWLLLSFIFGFFDIIKRVTLEYWLSHLIVVSFKTYEP